MEFQILVFLFNKLSIHLHLKFRNCLDQFMHKLFNFIPKCSILTIFVQLILTSANKYQNTKQNNKVTD